MSGVLESFVALAGGVGGAKLAAGLQHALGEALTVVVNTGDDFEHFGLHISPDLDTVMYTLAGLANASQGWGLEGETWNFMEQIARLGGAEWFRLGDRDLATHAVRTERLRSGATLTEVTAELCRACGVAARVIPMCDQPVRTTVVSDGKRVPFQDYFVRLRAEIPVSRIEFSGIDHARINGDLLRMTDIAKPNAVIICPSNPYLSIDPILCVPGIKEWLQTLAVPVIAVSPIVAGAAIKGPAAKIMRELGIPASAAAVAAHYRGLIDGFVIDEQDSGARDAIATTGVAVRIEQTVMKSDADRRHLAERCIEFARSLSSV